MDLHSTLDITGVAETSRVDANVLQKVLDDGQEKATSSVAGATGVHKVQVSKAIGVLCDSANPKVAAKKALLDKHPALTTVLCFVHQINLMMGV